MSLKILQPKLIVADMFISKSLPAVKNHLVYGSEFILIIITKKDCLFYNVLFSLPAFQSLPIGFCERSAGISLLWMFLLRSSKETFFVFE
ncbi:MAG: hypothetical protein JWR05_785 [Mucilaginibacter sp.]|nr:hypothetical protein [Mucilaginibacter sp.]